MSYTRILNKGIRGKLTGLTSAFLGKRYISIKVE
jgi:hypothetical protein